MACHMRRLRIDFILQNFKRTPNMGNLGALNNGVKYTTTSVIEITNFQNETELITISISGPPGDTWGIDSPELIMPNSSVNVTLNLPESGYEAVVWVIPDDSGTTLFTDIREVWG